MLSKQRTRLIKQISSRIAHQLGERVDRILLYGSYARGDARDDSDIDLLIITKDEPDHKDLIYQTSELVARISLDNDLVISRAFISKHRFETEESPFTLNVRREGIVL